MLGLQAGENQVAEGVLAEIGVGESRSEGGLVEDDDVIQNGLGIGMIFTQALPKNRYSLKVERFGFAVFSLGIVQTRQVVEVGG